MATIVKTEKRPLSLFGRLFRGLFLAFNLMMLFWMVSAMGAFSQLRSKSDAESLEQSIGAVAGFGVLIGLWIVIDLVLGILVLTTRAPKVLVEETVKPRWDARFRGNTERPGLGRRRDDRPLQAAAGGTAAGRATAS